jgi:transcriptional regulator with XRE-family HTH domain
MARLAKTARSYLNAVEKGRKNISLGTLARFAAILRVEVADLVPRQDELTDPGIELDQTTPSRE